MAKGITVHLSARDRKMCAEFRGDYKVLARKYNLTEVRVRQIVDSFQRAQYLSRQQGLPGLE
jgi:Mor family transcriptional regulator